MANRPSETEAVVRRHLATFVEQKGVPVLLEDYDDAASLYGEAGVWRGKGAIAGFFAAFIAGLPDGAISRFRLRSLRVDGELAYITWSAGEEIPLGTDTFVVRDGKIASQTFAMYAAR